MFMQDVQVELYQVLVDDGVGVVFGQLLVEMFQQFGMVVVIVEVEIYGCGIVVGWVEYVYLVLVVVFQGDGVEIVVGVGFDVQ